MHCTRGGLFELLEAIIKVIPTEDLPLQWDLSFAMIMLEVDKGRRTVSLFFLISSESKKGYSSEFDASANLALRVYLLGFHFCYGDLDHEDFIEPEGMTFLVDIVNNIIEKVDHPVSCIYMSVPKDRDDLGYIAPLENVNIPACMK